MTSKDQLDMELTQHFRDDVRRHDENDGEAVERVLAKLAHPLPQQRRAWRLWPAALLDWNFAPAWPQLAALASCAVLGFAVGVASPILHSHAAQMSPRSDLGIVITEPEPLTGELP